MRNAGITGLAAICLTGLLIHKAFGQAGTIEITFNDGGCPISVSQSTVFAQRGQKLTWQAVSSPGQAARIPFEIHFDPLRGSQLKGRSGKVSRNIDPKAPIADYKYTIVGLDCPGEVLDPRIRVGR